MNDRYIKFLLVLEQGQVYKPTPPTPPPPPKKKKKKIDLKID